MMVENTFGRKLKNIEYTTRPAVYGLVYYENQIALVKTPHGLYLPGGGIDAGESNETCLKREFLEETGYDIEIIKYIDTGVLYDYIPRLKRHYELMGHFYLVNLKSKLKEKIEMDHEFAFYDIKYALEHMKLSHQRWAVEKRDKNDVTGYKNESSGAENSIVE